MPEPIPDHPVNVAKALLTSPPRRDEEWKYIKEHEARKGK